MARKSRPGPRRSHAVDFGASSTRYSSKRARFHRAPSTSSKRARPRVGTADPGPLVAGSQFGQGARREVGGIVEGGTPGEDDRAVLAGYQVLEERGGSGRRGHHHRCLVVTHCGYQRLVPDGSHTGRGRARRTTPPTGSDHGACRLRQHCVRRGESRSTAGSRPGTGRNGRPRPSRQPAERHSGPRCRCLGRHRRSGRRWPGRCQDVSEHLRGPTRNLRESCRIPGQPGRPTLPTPPAASCCGRASPCHARSGAGPRWPATQDSAVMSWKSCRCRTSRHRRRCATGTRTAHLTGGGRPRSARRECRSCRWERRCCRAPSQ